MGAPETLEPPALGAKQPGPVGSQGLGPSPVSGREAWSSVERGAVLEPVTEVDPAPALLATRDHDLLCPLSLLQALTK